MSYRTEKVPFFSRCQCMNWRTHLKFGPNEWPTDAQIQNRAYKHLREQHQAGKVMNANALRQHNLAVATARLAVLNHRFPKPERSNGPAFTTNWRSYLGVGRNEHPSRERITQLARNKFMDITRRGNHTIDDLHKHQFLVGLARKRMQRREANAGGRAANAGRAGRTTGPWDALQPHIFRAGLLGHQIFQTPWWREHGRHL